MNTDGSEIINLTNYLGTDDQPVFSPNGSQIAFISRRDGNEEIYIMDSDGSDQTRLTNDPGIDSEPVFQP